MALALAQLMTTLNNSKAEASPRRIPKMSVETFSTIVERSEKIARTHELEAMKVRWELLANGGSCGIKIDEDFESGDATVKRAGIC